MSSAGLVAGCQTTTADSSVEGQAPNSVFAVSAEKQGLGGNRSTRYASAEVAEKPAREAALPASVRVTGVEVDVSVAAGRSVKGYTVSDAQAQAALRSGIVNALSGMPATGQDVVLRVVVERLFIPNPGVGALVGSNYPSAQAIVQMQDRRSGQPVGKAFKVAVGGIKASGGEFRPGIIGAAMQDGEAQEFANLSAALGNEIRAAIVRLAA